MDEELMHDCCCATCKYGIDFDEDEMTGYCKLTNQEKPGDEICNQFDMCRSAFTLFSSNHLFDLMDIRL